MKKSRAINVHLGSDLKEQWADHCESLGKSAGVMIKEFIERELLSAQGSAPPLPAHNQKIAPESPNKQKLRSFNSQNTPLEDRLLTAMERLLERGVSLNTITVEQLANEAGIARATFYLHFSGKSELLKNLTLRLTSTVINSAGEWFQEGTPDKERINLKHTLTGIFSAYRDHHAILKMIVSMSDQDETIAALYQKMIDHLCAQSRKAIAATTDGHFPGQASTESISDVLTQLITLFCAHNIGQQNDRDFAVTIDTFTHICQKTIFYKQ
jgi:TetR/AcrR family transcriptional regulator, ethionamide resistance regulator